VKKVCPQFLDPNVCLTATTVVVVVVVISRAQGQNS